MCVLSDNSVRLSKVNGDFTADSVSFTCGVELTCLSVTQDKLEFVKKHFAAMRLGGFFFHMITIETLGNNL
jgi:hypothetical protein